MKLPRKNKIKRWIRLLSPLTLTVVGVLLSLSIMPADLDSYFFIGASWGLIWCLLTVFANLEEKYDTTTIERILWDFWDELKKENLEKGLRYTVWVPIRWGRELLKITDYTPSDKKEAKKKKKQVLNPAKGIIGKCYRTRESWSETILVPPGDKEKFMQIMIEEWGFTEEEAEKLKDDRRAYLAFPVIGANYQILGVFYCDSSKGDKFVDDKLISKINDFIPTLRGYLYPKD